MKITLRWLGALALVVPMLSQAEPYPSTYAPLPSETILLKGGTILTGTGEQIDNGDVLIKDGKIAKVGKNLKARGAKVVELEGAWVTPGIIDVHSHLGAGGVPGVRAHSDVNEMTAPTTPDVWIEHSVWPQDQGFVTALAGGITALQILPGSANLIGGRTVTLKNVPSRTVAGMKFPGAPYGLKMACGENPKRVYGNKGRAPSTRMGNVAGYRSAWIDALDYKAKIEKAKEKGDPLPKQDLAKETLVGVLDGEILVHNHCYRADEMATMLDVAREFGYKVTAFHHAVEAYKIADLLADKAFALPCGPTGGALKWKPTTVSKRMQRCCTRLAHVRSYTVTMLTVFSDSTKKPLRLWARRSALALTYPSRQPFNGLP